MDTKLKHRLARLFRPSTLLRTPCNSSSSSGSIFTSSSSSSNSHANTSSRRSLSTATSYNDCLQTHTHDVVLSSNKITQITCHNEETITCPPASPMLLPMKKKKKKLFLTNGYGFTSSSDSSSSSETEHLFSSTDNNSFEFYQRRKSQPKHRRSSRRRRRVWHGSRRTSEQAEEEEEGVAVTKRSKDPYVDFRDSMVEMIVERQMFGARELERLLHCYLSLNAPSHHSVILRAFADISEVLFGH